MDIQRLPELQTAIKKNPDLYREEVATAYQTFHVLLEEFTQEPSAKHSELSALVTFLTQISPYFVVLLQPLPSELLNILDNYYSALSPDFRKTVFSGLILMRNREQIEAMAVLPTSFKMFRCPDKQLRAQAFAFIINDIKRINQHTLQQKINHKILTFIASMLGDSNVTAAKKSLHVLMTLYKRKIVKDDRIVNTIAQACLSPESKIATAGACFLLVADDDGLESDTETEEEEPNKSIIGKKKNKGSLHEKEREIKSFEKRLRRKERNQAAKLPSFLCIDQIHDPQSFVEKVFASVLHHFNKGKFKARVKLLHLVARMIGRHKLFLLDLYPYLLKYLKPKTNYVAQMLVIVSEACHDLLPPDDLTPVFKKLLHEFISDNCSEETITQGLNAAREMCKRQPLVMTKEIMEDLSGFRSFRNKAVVMASKSLINLYRDLNPTLLHSKDRGSLHGFQPEEYAEQRPSARVPGAELLEQSEEIKENYGRQTVFCRQQLATSENFKKLMKHKEKLEAEKEEEDKEIEGEKTLLPEEQEEAPEDGVSDEEIEESDEDESEESDEDVSSEEIEAPDVEMAVSIPNPFLPEFSQPPEFTSNLPFECDQFITQKEFGKIRTLQRMMEAKKRRAEVPVELLESDTDEESPHHFVEDGDISTFRRPKNERILEKREEKEKFKQKEKKGGKSNREHDKNKPTLMILPKLKRDLKTELHSAKKQLKNVKTQFRGHFTKRFKQNF